MSFNEKEFISVIMPVRNGGVFLDDAIQSVRTQTVSHYEFIIIDDGSTDETPDIIKRHAAVDPRIVSVCKRSIGTTRALNAGLSICRGEFVARMDADDICEPDRLRHQLAFLKKQHDVVAVGTQCALIGPNGKLVGSATKPLGHNEIDAFHLRHGGGGMIHPSVMMRRDALVGIRLYDEKFVLAQDGDLFLRLAEVGKLANLPDSLLRYRISPTQVSETHRVEQLQFSAKAVEAAGRRRGVDVSHAVAMILADASWRAGNARKRWLAMKLAAAAVFRAPTSSIGWRRIARSIFKFPPRASALI